MRVELYTSKNIKQCTSALTERFQQPVSKARPAMDGYVEKSGDFMVGLSSQVALMFTRTTRIRGKFEREGGVTVLRGNVSEGVPPGRIRLVMAALAAAGFIIMLNGEAMFGIFVMLLGLAMYIPLVGDHENSSDLIKELKRALDAKDRPPA